MGPRRYSNCNTIINMKTNETANGKMKIGTAVVLVIAIVLAAGFQRVSAQVMPANGFKVYFNTPPASNYIDNRVVDLINSSTSYCYVAVYAFNRASIKTALINAKNRGVSVKVVTEADNRNNATYKPAYDALVAAGITVVSDNRTALMHHKFIVIDDIEVLSGSYNMTDDQTTADKNNVLIIHSSGVASRYKSEVNQMFSGIFGASKVDYSGSNTVATATVYTKFSPKTDVLASIKSHIGTANTSVYFNIFTFTDRGVADALIARKNAAVTVKGSFDAWQAGLSASQYNYMLSSGVPVKKDTYTGLLHDKFMAIDGGTTSGPRPITGSFNWTQAANTSNDENCLVILDATVTNSYKGNAVYVYTYKAQ